MPGRTKVFEETAFRAADLQADMRERFLSDGRLEQWERELLAQAADVYAYADATATFVKAGIRFLGGGDVVGDGGLMIQVRETDALTAEARRKTASPSGLADGLVEVEGGKAA